jgi:SAM-dependent methyltransferase
MRNPLCVFRYLSENLTINYPDLILKDLTELQKRLSRPLKILDLGAGPGRYWKGKKLSNFLISTNSKLTLFDASAEFDSEAFPQGMFVDRKLGILPDDLNLIPDDEFDFVIALDLIEHLTKSQGYQLLYEIDRVSTGFSALLTPNGFVWQPPSSNNPFNAHISGWSSKDFKKLGWTKIRGQIGIRHFYGPYAIQKYRGVSNLKLEFIALTKIVSFLLPKLAFSLYVTKKVKNPRIVEQK